MDDPRTAVRETYDRIASHFASTREYPWPEVESFVTDATADGPATRALDLGCGNGRHVELLSGHADDVVGLDVSRGLLDEATTRATDRGFDAGLVQGDASRLPFVDDAFDLAVYVATLHHLTPRESRVASLDELARVLASDGRAVVSAWSTAHDTFDREEGFDTTVDWTLPGGETVPRFYHIYSPDEFDADLAESSLTVVESEISSGNCYAIVSGV
ncbi:methyltransferase domain-containing protein [Haloferax sp. MBLA0076]|uniref:Methyltransferase domain-containing protein n=1 Tax=Haloferax litoreum TaxID=2666140 RepID=A0A6A8GM77_9EURY|nr:MULTISPECIES: class I SAM-dependent methyltransferase [Haloferax]KAB1194753.1 class I SAM-dependent methyltransferase [Haloferax sp. CBA1148]MRX23337.1 methyltransferase domain-containing protein [Haloferax litoreum]